MLHGDTCLFFEGAHPQIEPIPLKGPDGKQWPAGSEFIFLGGHKASAGFEWLSFQGFAPAKYLGQMPDGDKLDPGWLAVFRQDESPLFGWNVSGDSLMWGNANHSGRVIELHRATLVGQAIPPHKGRGKIRPPQNWPEWHECLDCYHVERFEFPDGEACRCSKCQSANLNFYSSRFASQRAAFDAMQAEFGHPADVAPPPPLE